VAGTARIKRRSYNIVVSPAFVRYDAPGWGVGELWLEGEHVLHSELPRPGPTAGAVRDNPVVERLQAYFAGRPADFAGVSLELDDGFYGDCERALRALPQGEVVSYGELAALAGRPGAARAAGTFCARNRLGPFVPCHRVVGAHGLGSYGSLGIGYKRRLLEMDGIAV
jgi:methylated-DNA-[protein]-cysteine S-methyltransferase